MTVSFNLAPGYSLGAAVDTIKQIEHDETQEKGLVAEYRVSRDTARKARKAVSEFVENSILDK